MFGYFLSNNIGHKSCIFQKEMFNYNFNIYNIQMTNLSIKCLVTFCLITLVINRVFFKKKCLIYNFNICLQKNEVYMTHLKKSYKTLVHTESKSWPPLFQLIDVSTYGTNLNLWKNLKSCRKHPDNMYTFIQRWIYVSLFVGTTYSFFGGPIPFCTTAPRWLD